MKKRIISLILALTLCVGMLPAPAWAEEPTDPTQAAGVVGDTNPSEETDPTTEPTEEETEPTEEETEPTEEETEPTEEETDPTEGLLDQTIPEEVAAYAASLPETISGTVTLDNYQGTETLKLDGDTTLVLKGENKIECEKPLDLNGHELTIQGTGSLELVGSNNSGATPPTSGAIYDSTWTSTSTSSTGRMVIESGTVIARDDVKNAVAVRYLHMTGGKLEAYGARSGIVTTELKMTAGSLYATGSTRNGIDMWKPYYVSAAGLNILVSNEPNAEDTNMEDGTTKQIENSEPKTVAIGKFSTSPSISVQAQQGYLYEATAKTATFALSGRNVDLSALTLEWTGAHTGLEAAASADGKTLTVTTDETVQAGTYGLKVSAGGASRTAVVTVSGPPICIYVRPVDTISADPEAGLVSVSAYLTKGHSGFIDFQWKREDGTVMVGYTDETVPLIDLVELGMLTQDASKPWLQTIRIYCTLSYDGYSLDTETVTVGLNSCKHPKVDHEGNCTQCGQKRGSNGDALIVREDGLYHLIADAESGKAHVGPFMYGGGNFWLTGDVQKTTVDVSDTDGGGKNVTLDLQGHTVKNLQMGNFPYGTFTVKNGTLGEIHTSASGKLILENILYQGKWFDEEFELTVQGENTRFERQVTFWGTTHLKGGLFSQGLDSDCAGRALELLEDGFAFYDNDNKVVDATDSAKLVGRKIRVASHICSYRYGKCACGRSCDHQGTTDENGYCTNCGTFVYPFAIGEKLYTGLEAALTAAQEGDTVTLRGDYDMQAAAVEITKSITLELNGHTLSSWPYAPILTILAPDVTIQNGTVKNTDTSKSSPAVEVGSLDTTEAKLTVKDAIFEGSESNGNPRNYGLSIFAGNTAQVENGTFTGGISVNGSLTLSGGKADHIYVGTGVTYASLLAKGYAYQAKGQLVKREDMADGIAVEVVKCGHPDGLTDTEPCAYCGLTCTHSTVNDKTGLCQECGSQVYEANVTTADGSVTGYRTLEEALGNGRNATVKLLADCKGEDTFCVTEPLTLDLNGKRMEGPSGLIVKDGPTTILDSSPAQTGTIAGTSNWKYSGVGLGVFNNANVTLTILGGHFEGETDGLQLAGQNNLILKGGSFSSINFKEGATATLWDALAPGYAYYKDADNTLYDPGDNQEVTVGLHVGAHPEHTPDSSGHCPCGYTAAAMLDTGAGKQYFADFSAALEAAKAATGSTLTLLRDVTHSGDSGIYIDSGTFTIDWNGHTLSGSFWGNLLTITDSANVTLKDSSGTNTGGARQTGKGAAVRIAVGSEGIAKIQGGTYSPNVTRAERCYGSVQISGGVFENTKGYGQTFALYNASGSLSGMLADGTAFAYGEDGSDLLNAYDASQSDAYTTVYAVEHTHENFDEDGVCDCGYPCPHDQVDEWGECILCGKRFYVQGTYADGTTHYYGTISDALGDPDVTQAKILRALTEECESWNGGDRSVTLDLNYFGAVIKSVRSGHLILRDSSESGSILEVKEIQKDGQVTVESGTVFPQGENPSVYVSGKLTVTGGKVDSLTAMEGSTVSLSGGSFGKIVGSGVTLRSLLAEDRYYAELDGEDPKNYADTDTVIEGVSVKRCDHTSVRKINAAYGWPQYKCNCGKVTYLLTVTVGESDKKYFGDYNTGFDYAAKNDGVVRFLKLPDGTIEVNAQGMVTIDMENRSYSANDRSLVIKSGSTVKLVGQGSVMSTPEAGGDGSGSSGKLEYSEFIPVTVEAGGTFVLPAKKLGGGENMAKPTNLTVQSGGTAELQGGSTHWTDVYGTLKISGGSHSNIHQYEKGQLNITDGQITRLEIHGDIPQNALSGGSYVTISVWEFQFGESEKLRDVTFADFQKMLVSGKVFQKKQDQSYPNEVEETPNYGTFNYKKELNKVNVTAAPFTGVQVVCQLGADTYEDTVSTQYNVGEMDSSGNVVFRLGVRTQPQEIQSGVTVQWYQLGAEDSRTLVGTGLTCPLDRKLPVGTHRFLAVVNCSGYVLESQPFAVTVTPRVVNITGGFTAQDRDYAPDETTVTITKGTVTFDKKAEGDDLGAQVNGGTVATPEAGQNKAVTYSATLTGEDKDNYILGSVPELTVTIRPIAQTLAFAEAAVTKTYGDSPFVNALDHSAGDGPIIYASSDPAVATVGTDGTVTIRGAGEARITATAAATQNYVETAASFDLTVAKATGTVRNRNYSLGYLYGDDIPTPERKYFEASSTGAFRYSWSPAAPKNAGKYQLTVTVDEDGNYTSATLVLNVLVEKDVWVRPTLVKAENETVDGKKDGKVTYTDTPALEYRPKRTRGEWIPVAVPAGEESVTVEGLAPGTYEFRRPGDENHFASSPETITIQPGPKLTVTLPSPQTGYTLTADKVELSWHDTLKLTLTVAEGYYKTASFAVKAGDRVFTEDKGTYTLTDVEEDLTITLEGVEKDEKAPSLALRNWIFGQGVFQGTATRKDWENISTATAPYFVISNRGNYFAVEAWDGETGLASVSYLLSRTALTREALEQAAWEPVPEESLNQAGPDREHMIQLGLGEWYFYVKAVDKAGNVSYVGSDKLIREENAPTFSGVTNGATYYTTQKVTITDDYALSRYLPPLSGYWKDISGTSYEVTLEGNQEGTYTIKVEDACQNTGTITVYMKPISALTEDIRDLTEDNVRKSDLSKLNQAEKALKDLDITHATDEEKKEITGALDNIGKLKTVLEEVTQVEAMIADLPETVEPWDAETEKRVLDTRSAYDAMTDHQKTMVDDSKLRTLEGQLVDYRFTSGENQTWALGCGKELRFTVNGQLAKVKEVRLNGQAVDTEKTAQAKGTEFTLRAFDLQVLGVGSYTLQVIFTDGQTPQTQVTVTVSPNYLDLSGYPDFDNEENVTVNGRIYPIGTDGGRYVILPETGDILQRFTYLNGTYSAAHENYPTGMAAYRIIRQEGGAKLEPIEGLKDLLIYSGCSIRISGKQGIRMITGITQDNKKALTSKAGLSGYTLEEYGTLICWNTDVTSGDDFSLDMSCARHNYAYLKGKADPVFAKQDGKMLYTNVLVGFSLEDCAKDLILRPYIKLKDMTTGETVTLYGGSVCRSIGYIAKQNADTYKPGSSGYKYVHKIIDAVYGQEP